MERDRIVERAEDKIRNQNKKGKTKQENLQPILAVLSHERQALINITGTSLLN